ncbi:MAG: hypothetical protein H0W29_16405 [Gemmatimonadales bacterium]|nr:hypothetical protein [Gemmatimonadales bacterium]
MKAKDRRLLLRAIAGELDSEKRARLDERLASEPGLRTAFERMGGVHALVREIPRTGFRPGFAGRVAARLAVEAPRRLSAALALHFRRLAPAALAVILGLLAHNLLTGGPDSQSAVEAALGLQPVTLEVAYDLDSALYEAAP